MLWCLDVVGFCMVKVWLENIVYFYFFINKNRVWCDTEDNNSFKHNVYPDLNRY